MASPWKLLARLVSPRRQQRQEHGSTDDEKPEALAITKPTETAAKNELAATDRPAAEKPFLDSHSAAVSVDADHSEESASAVDGRADIEGAKSAEAADPALPDGANAAARAAPKTFRVGDGQTRKRSMRRTKVEEIAVVLPPSRTVSATFEDAINLDEEIRLLRDQLARKLQIQNTQLKRMLQRFER
ncbi:hypothetical protein ACU8NH_37155 (plasmid) [Rhizobium leguminosarum]|jgi:hypothetical protein|uniref:Uncharacterized protein n=1 Tax=Rhizobium ruizarguesonis TaxID=2081791 RepID=A0AAE8PRY8_9HYPH|nr:MULTISPECIES: hypothetical protein [Rhizobium]QJS32647.1 hypothetical protein RLTA1_36290 [Rhizobium leguminosarum bv. trifolii TA1]QIO49502.1 hypothetical protein HA464_37065 [Rhizobium leguminosarum bv. trifolii]QIO63158.1 hypothetical protein HA463_36295 [Rhizobium leguminosarum bv. trifolii]RWX23985.1 hypothetical protein EHH54_37515 [Rhizobium leguminosarum]TAT70333.1 hypothetical protein ELI56_36950 [Rhizobium ruizarguesonis]